MAQIFICKNRDWKPYPGAIIPCDDIRIGPYYCPKCKEKLTVVDTQNHFPLHLTGNNRQVSLMRYMEA